MDWYVFETSDTNASLRDAVFHKSEDLQYTVAMEARRVVWLV
jgi:hypothetical protein